MYMKLDCITELFQTVLWSSKTPIQQERKAERLVYSCTDLQHDWESQQDISDDWIEHLSNLMIG